MAAIRRQLASVARDTHASADADTPVPCSEGGESITHRHRTDSHGGCRSPCASVSTRNCPHSEGGPDAGGGDSESQRKPSDGSASSPDHPHEDATVCAADVRIAFGLVENTLGEGYVR